MIHIILMVLKIAGLLLLLVLGLLFLLLLLVLFVPVRFGLQGSYKENIRGQVRISWLLHILSLTVLYDEKTEVSFRLFGIRLRKPGKGRTGAGEEEDMAVQAMELREEEEKEERKEPERRTVRPKEQAKESKKQPEGKRKIEKLKFSFRRICDTLKNIKEKKNKLQEIISSRENQKTARLLFKQARRLIRHLFPKKGQGTVTFGFDDPYLTGQVLTYASLLYPFFYKRLKLIPVFDRAVFLAEGKLAGRLRLGTVLFIGLRMLLDKNFRILLKKWLR